MRKTRIFGLGLIASPFVGLFGAGICFAGIIPTLTVTVLATLVVAAITGGVYLVTRA